jgi:hypothetical protein
MTDYLDPRGTAALQQQNARNTPNLNDPIQRAVHGGDAPQPGSHGFDAHERVQGVTVCVNYSDFLEVTLEENLSHFSEFVVVTDYRDRKTQGVCQKHSVYCVQTDVFFERPGDVFNKGAAINLGIAHLRKPGWFVHLDADIVLPDRFNTALHKARLDPECIYGADRLEVVGFEQWQKQQSHGAYKRQHQYRCLLQNPGNRLGARLIHNEYGYCPIGYFQLWHSSTEKRYPHNVGSAEHTDVLFACQWPLRKRLLLPTVLVYHLQSEAGRMGVNWEGRKTKPFGPA